MVNLEKIVLRIFEKNGRKIIFGFSDLVDEWELGCVCAGLAVSSYLLLFMITIDMEQRKYAREESLQQQKQYAAYQRECVLSIAKTLSHAKSEHDGDLRSVGAPVIVDKWGTSMTVRYGNKYYFDGDFILDCSNGPTQVIQNNDQLTIYLGMEQMKEYSKK